MIRTEKRLRLCNCLIAGMLVFIWGNSLLPGELSQALSDWAKTVLSALLPGEEATGQGSGLLRKLAHFTEFAALGAALGWRCAMLRKQTLVPFLYGTAVACVDECIQWMTPGRAPRVTDVLIDSSGVLTGLSLLYFGYYVCKKMIHLEDKQ